jgi:hypothetical protein
MEQLIQSGSTNSFLLSFISSENVFDTALPIDYLSLALIAIFTECWALKQNWVRWSRDEYNHQFDHNIGIGNLRADYDNGNYGFDPLHLRPIDPVENRSMIEKELNHGRLAMIAFVGILVQEYVTGVPLGEAFKSWSGIGDPIITVQSGAQASVSFLTDWWSFVSLKLTESATAGQAKEF